VLDELEDVLLRSLVFREGIENDLNEGGYDGKYFNLDSVKLIEASPSTCLGKTHENSLHDNEVHLIGTVGDHNL
jgi:hypothetical protein